MNKDLKDEKTAASSAGRVKVGDIVTRAPITFFGFENKQHQSREGRVVYIHPKGRYHVVEFPGKLAVIREAFFGV